MPDLSFPFWVVTHRQNSSTVPVTVGSSEVLAVFTAADHAARYMVSRGDETFEFRLVSRATFHPLADEWLRAGVRTLCLDPDGECKAVLDLAATAAKLSVHD